MRNNIRHYLPSHFKGLISEQPAVKKWHDPKYLFEKLKGVYVEAHNYLLHENLKPFAGSHVVKEQTGRFVPFAAFWDRFLEKFDDDQI